MPIPHASLRRCFAYFLAALPVMADPTASDASFSEKEDTVLNVPAATGLMSYVAPNGASALLISRVTNPAHGSLTLNTDGSFTYTPEANYSGPDSFTYKAVEAGAPIPFTVDQTRSVLTIRADSNVSGTVDNDTATASVVGTMAADLTPQRAPFATARVLTADLSTAAPAQIELCVARFLGACITSLTAILPTDGLSLIMRGDQSGPAAPVNAAGVFNQTGNRMDVTGNLVLSGAAVSLLGLNPNQSINTANMDVPFNGATIVEAGGTLTLTVPVDVTQTLVDPNYTVTLRITGNIVSTAPVPAAPPESNVATVTLDVTPVDDAPVSHPDRYYTRQNVPLTIDNVFGVQPATETLIPAKSAWKYFTGSEPPAAWRTIAFADTAWTSGAGVLGFDTDNPIDTTLPAGNNSYYFRRSFTVAGATETTAMTLEFQRDDACIIYLNGLEVYRDSTPYTTGGARPIPETGDSAYTIASAVTLEPDSAGAAYKRVSIPPSLLVNGQNVIAAIVKQNGSSDLRWDLSATRVRQPVEELRARGATWKYSSGTSLGTAWRSPEYNDSTWASMPGPAGFDADITPAVPGDPFGASGARHPTAYFRGEFTLATPFDTLLPRIDFQRDDACVIYVNGVEVYRDSAPYPADADPPLSATGEIAYATFSAATIQEDDSHIYKSITFSRSLLREGRNIIAAEVHQAGAGSSDLRWDAAVLRTTGVGGVVANDTDIDGPGFDVVVHSQPANGTLVPGSSGTFTYTPAPGFPASGASATDSFIYAQRDAAGQLFLNSTTLVTRGSTWRFLDNGTAAPQDAGITTADWRNAAFDDTVWKSGLAEFGYGENDQATLVEDDATPGYDAAAANRYITTYFRHKFTYSGSTALLNVLRASVIYDDGIVIWLNGQVLLRENMPAVWSSITPALNSREGAPAIAFNTLPVTALREGENILAVEIHQERATSSDISFDLLLSADTVSGARVEIVVLNDDIDGDNMSDTWERAHGIDDTVANAGLDPDGDGQTHRQEFLAGTDPRTPASTLRGQSLTPTASPQLLDFTFHSVPGKTYRIEHSDDLTAWLPSGTIAPAHATAATTTVQVLRPAARPSRFYRAAVLGDWD